MTAFHVSRPRKSRGLLLIVLGLVSLIVMAGLIAAGSTYYWYQRNIEPIGTSEMHSVISIEEGASVVEIAELLEEEGIIRSATAFDWYTRVNNVRGQLQAGTYKFSPSESVADIVDRLLAGDVATDIFTILPAQRIDQVRKAFMDAGYSREEIADAFKADQYADHPALAFKPREATLEGYLYPETFQRTANTSVSDIIRASLDEMAKVLTPTLREQLQSQGLNVHEAIIMASIVEREVSNPEDRAKVAQVFLKRYREGMMLGSDPTALYGALLAGIEPSVFADTPYNTRLYVGLPPGPINNVSKASLDALANPADTAFLYFVSGDDGNTYFSYTLEEHEALTAQYCIELCRSY